MQQRNKGTRLERFISDYVVLDIETTSNRIYDAKIIEIGAIKVRDGKVVDIFESLINPQEPIPASATAVNHITDDMVQDAPTLEQVLDDFLTFISGEILVGHNIASFDLNILYDAIEEYNGFILNNDFIDTLFLARKCLDCIENHKLETISTYYGLDISNEHRALKDCYLTKDCFQLLQKQYEEHGFIKGKKNKLSIDKRGIKYSDETKSLQQLQGFLLGIIADNMLTEEEILALNAWMDENQSLKGNYPFDRVYGALERVLDDGVIEQDELDSLLVIFKQFTTPVNEENDKICIETLKEKHCCLTGGFSYGDRKDVEKLIRECGGICDNTVKKTTTYLVVGTLGSDNWKQGTYGEKIKKAMEWQEKGSKIQIVPEECFISEAKKLKEEILKTANQEEILTVEDLSEDVKGWKKNLQKMLDELIQEKELPEHSLYLAQNSGRMSDRVTSYSVCIYEPEYPKIPNRKLDYSRNSVVMNIKERKDKLELIIGNSQYKSISFSGELEAKQLKSDKNNIHIIFKSDDERFVEYVKLNTEYRIKCYSSKASTFGCCSQFVECSDARKCVHENKLYSMACSYRKNLDKGKIFYGKNRNID